jgi:hypothetical protein
LKRLGFWGAVAGSHTDDLLDHSADVLERQYSNRGLVRKRKRRTYKRTLAKDPKCPDRLGDVFHPLLAEIGEGQRQLCADLIPHRSGNANATRLSNSFQAGSDVNGVAEKIVALHYDVADVDANPKPHLLARRSIRILFGDGLLNRDGTLHGIHSTREVSDEAIASSVEDPTPMRGDQAIDDGPVSVENVQGADLILPHEATVAFDIGGEDRRELSFDGVRFQGSAPPRSSIARSGERSERCRPFWGVRSCHN